MDMRTEDFDTKLSQAATAVSSELARLLGNQHQQGEIARPMRLMAAMRHGALNGGKRLRPFLLMEVAAMLGGEDGAALQAACALESVHCYSLVHDDLPAMDDDNLRRGQPTVHIAYDDATAILAGDGLLTFAFEVMSNPANGLHAEARSTLVFLLAQAAGIGGMVGGQMLDIEAESNSPDEMAIKTLQAMKTGALIRFACEAGAVVAGADADTQAKFRQFGEKIGLAFQLADDLLDLTSDATTLGKATGKDAHRGKGTLPALKGEEWTRAKLDELIKEAETLLSPYGEKAKTLIAAAQFVANRKH